MNQQIMEKFHSNYQIMKKLNINKELLLCLCRRYDIDRAPEIDHVFECYTPDFKTICYILRDIINLDKEELIEQVNKTIHRLYQYGYIDIIENPTICYEITQKGINLLNKQIDYTIIKYT